MAAHRISLAHGLLIGFLAIFAGSLYLALACNPLTGMLHPAHGGRRLRRHLLLRSSRF